MPNHKAQEALVRDTYRRAGLDPDSPNGRCQYFEAHGTGTQAGDPQEAEAISRAFFGQRKRAEGEDPLYVGSIKTIIGHTEGTAGIAGLMKASLAVQTGLLPPNMLFENLSPKVAPFYQDLHLVTGLRPWPAVAPGQPRRASVNSFGFGGTNAHIIVENYQPEQQAKRVANGNRKGETHVPIAPVVVSAANESSLRALMEDLASWLRKEPDLVLADLVWTLLKKRSVLPVRRAISSQNLDGVIATLEREANLIKTKQGLSFTASETRKTAPHILGIFTGQGAQWPAMGKVLLSTIPYARQIVSQLDESLAALPSQYRPDWTLGEQLSLEGESSRVYDARFSQPLCCAVQILLVQLLGAAGLAFKVVVGHSSGEIACAYAAGLISASQAIRIAYLRGAVSSMAKSPNGAEGAMMAAGMSLEDAQELCGLENFAGRICVAASNSPTSVTLSGDRDAILEAQEVLEEESKFSRLLKVDKAYHSHHMVPCGASYVEALKLAGCDIPEGSPSSVVVWVSSVHEGKIMKQQDLRAEYWRDNMVAPVLFSHAVEEAVIKFQPLDLAVEVGPHPALKNPALDTIENCTGRQVPYTGCMERNKNDAEALTTGLGYVWERFGSAAINIDTLHDAVMPSTMPAPTDLSKTLPPYPFDHSRSFKRESRATKAWLRETAEPHKLLGKLSANSTSSMFQWQNFLKTTDMDWVDGHSLQGQTVFPGAGYAVMAMEAAIHALGGAGSSVRLIEILDLHIDKAVTFEDESSMVELVLTLHVESQNQTNATFSFAIDSCLAKETNLSTSAGGRVAVTLGPASSDALPRPLPEPPHMNKVNIDSFYSLLGGIGYGYTKEFRGVTIMRRADGKSCGTIGWPQLQDVVMHPASLDVAFQSFIGAFMTPGDGRLRSLLVPTGIDRIAVNPQAAVRADKSGQVGFNAATFGADDSRIGGDIEVFTADDDDDDDDADRATVLQIEGLAFKPFSPPTAADDHLMFSEWTWGPYSLDATFDKEDYRATDDDQTSTVAMERLTYFYVRQFLAELTSEDRATASTTHYRHQIRWCERVLEQARKREHYCYDPAWENDDLPAIKALIAEHARHPFIRLLERVGENILPSLRQDLNPFEILDRDGLLTEFYGATESYGIAYRYFEDLVGQIGHRHQNMDVLEIGAGTGGATRHILGEGRQFPFNSYTFTDISSAFFDQALAEFGAHQDKLVFRSLDVRRDPEPQGFAPNSYDMVVASNVLHATPSLETTLTNVRKLLKPGGHLVIIEVTHHEHWRIGFIFGLFADWWAGVEEGRVFEPFVSMGRWGELLKQTGFSGVDARTLDPDSRVFPNSVFSTHAVSDKIDRLWSGDAQQQPESSRAASSPSLVVIGGASPRTAKIVDRVRSALPHRRVRAMGTLQELLRLQAAGAGVESGSTFVVLTELQGQDGLFTNLDEDKLEATQLLFQTAANVLWVTEDAWVTNPEQAMSIGLLRTLRLEYVDVQIQCLDVDHIGGDFDVGILVQQLSRLEQGANWEEEGLLWTQEPEIRLIGGRLVIPRLRSDVAKNNRLNASRRPILTDVDPTEHVVELTRDDSGEVYLAAAAAESEAASRSEIEVLAHFSSANAIRVGNAGLFHLIQGVPTSTLDAKPVIALAACNASKVKVDAKNVIALPGVDAKTSVLHSLLAEVVAQTVLANSNNPGSTILLLEPPQLWADAVVRRAAEKKINVSIASFNPQAPKADNWIQLHESETQRGLAIKLPSNVSALFNFSADLEDSATDFLSRRLAKVLSASAAVHRLGHLVQGQAALNISISSGNDASSVLAGAVQAVSKPRSPNLSSQQSSMVPVHVAELTAANVKIDTIVGWGVEGSTLPARIRPVDSGDLFTKDGSYLLVGLAGDLGRSICRWMVQHGARNVVLSSRYPRVDNRWVEEVQALGGNIMVLPMDVSDEASVDAGLARIRGEMPPLKGVAFGPLVLQDILFKNMDLDMMKMVLAPKVTGARLLDARLAADEKTNPLDFFVMFSSFVMVSGNPGQAAYSAANAYTHAIANQRRARGKAGSTIDIGAVYGVGFISRAGREEEYDVVKFMFDAVSEQELQTLFAEAVVADRVRDGSSIELVTGMPFIDPANRDRIPYFDDPRLAYFRLPSGGGAGDAAATSLGSVKDRLQTAITREEVAQVIIDGLIGKLRSALQLTSEDTVSAVAPLIDQGVDSLSAVTVGGWFSKNLHVDIPVLKILGGASVTDLVEEAMTKLSAEMTPLVQLVSDSEQTSSGKSLPATSKAVSTSVSVSASTPSDGASALSTRATSPERDGGAAEKERQGDLSFSQEYLWKRQEQLQLDPVIFNSTIGMFMRGSVDVDRLTNAFNTALRRHDAFRASFQTGSDGQPQLKTLAKTRARFVVIPVTDRGAAEEALHQLHARPYNLGDGVTVRAVLFTWSNTDHLLVWAYNQLAGDGYTTEHIFVEVGTLYEGGALPPAPSFLDFAKRQRRECLAGEFSDGFAFWQRLHSPPLPMMPIMSLPGAVSKRVAPSWVQHEHSVRVNPMVAVRIRERSRKHKATAMHFYLAALHVVLARLSGQDELAIGIADSTRLTADDRNTMGHFVNILPIRLRAAAADTFGEALVAAKEHMRGALLHSDVPYPVVLDSLSAGRGESLDMENLVQTVFDYKQGQAESGSIGGAELVDTLMKRAGSPYDVVVEMSDDPARDPIITVKLQASLYGADDAKAFADGYLSVLSIFSRNPALRISEGRLGN